MFIFKRWYYQIKLWRENRRREHGESQKMTDREIVNLAKQDPKLASFIFQRAFFNKDSSQLTTEVGDALAEIAKSSRSRALFILSRSHLCGVMGHGRVAEVIDYHTTAVPTDGRRVTSEKKRRKFIKALVRNYDVSLLTLELRSRSDADLVAVANTLLSNSLVRKYFFTDEDVVDIFKQQYGQEGFSNATIDSIVAQYLQNNEQLWQTTKSAPGLSQAFVRFLLQSKTLAPNIGAETMKRWLVSFVKQAEDLSDVPAIAKPSSVWQSFKDGWKKLQKALHVMPNSAKLQEKPEVDLLLNGRNIEPSPLLQLALQSSAIAVDILKHSVLSTALSDDELVVLIQFHGRALTDKLDPAFLQPLAKRYLAKAIVESAADKASDDEQAWALHILLKTPLLYQQLTDYQQWQLTTAHHGLHDPIRVKAFFAAADTVQTLSLKQIVSVLLMHQNDPELVKYIFDQANQLKFSGRFAVELIGNVPEARRILDGKFRFVELFAFDDLKALVDNVYSELPPAAHNNQLLQLLGLDDRDLVLSCFQSAEFAAKFPAYLVAEILLRQQDPEVSKQIWDAMEKAERVAELQQQFGAEQLFLSRAFAREASAGKVLPTTQMIAIVRQVTDNQLTEVILPHLKQNLASALVVLADAEVAKRFTSQQLLAIVRQQAVLDGCSTLLTELYKTKPAFATFLATEPSEPSEPSESSESSFFDYLFGSSFTGDDNLKLKLQIVNACLDQLEPEVAEKVIASHLDKLLVDARRDDAVSVLGNLTGLQRLLQRVSTDFLINWVEDHRSDAQLAVNLTLALEMCGGNQGGFYRRACNDIAVAKSIFDKGLHHLVLGDDSAEVLVKHGLTKPSKLNKKYRDDYRAEIKRVPTVAKDFLANKTLLKHMKYDQLAMLRLVARHVKDSGFKQALLAVELGPENNPIVLHAWALSDLTLAKYSVETPALVTLLKPQQLEVLISQYENLGYWQEQFRELEQLLPAGQSIDYGRFPTDQELRHYAALAEEKRTTPDPDQPLRAVYVGRAKEDYETPKVIQQFFDLQGFLQTARSRLAQLGTLSATTLTAIPGSPTRVAKSSAPAANEQHADSAASRRFGLFA